MDNRPIGNTDINHGLRGYGVRNTLCTLVHLPITVRLLQRLDENHTALVYRRHEILHTGSIHPFHRLQQHLVVLGLCLHQKDDPFLIILDVQLLRLIVDVHKKHIIEKKILEKTILIDLFLVSTDQPFHLLCAQTAYKLCLLTSHIFNI